MINKYFIFIFFIFFINSSIANNNQPQISGPDIPVNNPVNKIKDNLVNKEEIFLTPISDDYYKNFKSFMLGDSIISIIKKALDININKQSVTSSNIVGEIEEDGGFSNDIGNIYLKSIIFLSNNFWSIWINDKKITNKTNNDENNEFVVQKINNNEATILLRVNKTKWSYINSANKITENEYKVNENNQIEFLFKLSPNQTFVASENKVIDGKYRNEEELLMNSINNQTTDFNLDNLFDANSFNFNDL